MKAVVVILVALFAICYGQFFANIRLPDEALDFAMKNPAQKAAKTENPAVCITVNFKRCQSAFDNILGFDTTLDWKNSFALTDAIQNYAQGDRIKFLNLCYARSYFYQCLGAQYASCVSLYNLLDEDGSTASEAYNFVQTFHSLDFICNAGFEEVLNQYACMKGVTTGSPDYDMCISNFSTKLGQQPQQFCSHVNETSQCIQKAFSKGCQATDPRGSGWFGCETFRQSFEETCGETSRCFVH
ncbi:hypothetical protein PFISCL1PPCAC_14329 [Pristionchus fissidentatus]|uniref:DUF19 domain-containing protein n=1 Tax=Pristionchus fissidentatus TaxID=1538716 RepID=A0AAV5VTM3_9BILA|nr:hypothetical protein PFISCL1PPCAC_14329 [Pristionchus fissidentatus]